MASVSGVGPLDDRDPPREAVRLQLERILESTLFKRSIRLTKFLKYVVEQTLAGQRESLKESVLALELYGRSDFESGVDPVVRVDARRLRDKLREYYVDSPHEPIVILLPKGSYAPVFEYGRVAAAPVAPDGKPPVNKTETATIERRTRIWSTLGIVFLLSVVIVLLFQLRTAPSSQALLRPLVSLAGMKGTPSLSPDGRMVVFFWSGPPDKPSPGIYIKPVDGENLHWLAPAAADADPAWSPLGSDIAFSRSGPNPGVFVISQLGGEERRIAESGTAVTWTPDGASLLFRDRDLTERHSGIFSVSLKTRENRRLTFAPLPAEDFRAAVSPDGATLAFIRSGVPGLGDVYIVPMAGGEPRRLTDWNTRLDGLAWTPDGEEIIYSVEEPVGPRLWRISARGASPARGTRLAESTGDAALPTVSKAETGGDFHLAYLTRRQESSLRLVDLTHRDDSGVLTTASPFQRSSRWDYGGRFSPDGKSVAFISTRAGTPEIWISGFDGSNLRRLTDIKGDPVFASWSKDSRRIAFLSAPGGVGVKRIYVVNADGGEPKPLTSETEIVFPGGWSQDSRWFYFMSNRSGSFQIWKMNLEGDQRIQITHNGGVEAQESPDGKYLYYTKLPPGEPSGRENSVPLMRVPVSGGEEIPILPEVRTFHWSVTDMGIYYFFPVGSKRSIMRYRFDNGKTESIGDLPNPEAPLDGDMSVSRDGHWLFMSQVERDDTDLMIIDRFR